MKHLRTIPCFLLLLLAVLLLSSCENGIPAPSSTGNTVTPSEITQPAVQTAPESDGPSAEGTAVHSRAESAAENPTAAAEQTTSVPPVTTAAATAARTADVTSANPQTAQTRAPLTTAQPKETSEAPVTTAEPEIPEAPETAQTTEPPAEPEIPEASDTAQTTEPPAEPEVTDAPLPDFSDPELYGSDYAYSQLSVYPNAAQMQNLYREIASAALDFHRNNRNAADTLQYSEKTLRDFLTEINFENPSGYASAGEITVSSGLSPEEINIAAFSFRLDHPLYYWNSPLMFCYETEDISRHFVLCCYAEYSDGSARQAINQTIYSECEVWYGSVIGSSAYAAAKSAHDMICEKLDYLHEAPSWDEDNDAHSVIAYFQGSGGVCEGYAAAFQLFMNVRGIPCISVQNLTHIWNLIQLDDGEWYWVDVTYDDYPEMYVCFCKNDTEDIWTGSGYAPGQTAADNTFLGMRGHTLLPPGGPETEYEGKTYQERSLFFIYALPERSSAPYQGPKD